jgi:hypothetical protein
MTSAISGVHAGPMVRIPSFRTNGVRDPCLPRRIGDERPAFLKISGQRLQAPPQREARAALGVLLQLVGKGSDHQIAAEAQRGSGAMQFPPSQPQLVRRLIDQLGNFVFDLCDARVSRSAVPVAASFSK